MFFATAFELLSLADDSDSAIFDRLYSLHPSPDLPLLKRVQLFVNELDLLLQPLDTVVGDHTALLFGPLSDVEFLADVTLLDVAVVRAAQA